MTGAPYVSDWSQPSQQLTRSTGQLATWGPSVSDPGDGPQASTSAAAGVQPPATQKRGGATGEGSGFGHRGPNRAPLLAFGSWRRRRSIPATRRCRGGRRRALRRRRRVSFRAAMAKRAPARLRPNYGCRSVLRVALGRTVAMGGPFGHRSATGVELERRSSRELDGIAATVRVRAN